MSKAIKFYFTAVFCLSVLISSCDLFMITCYDSQWEFFVTLTIKNETDATVDITLDERVAGDNGNGLVWGQHAGNDGPRPESSVIAAIPSGGSENVSVTASCATYSTEMPGLASFMLWVNGDKLYAGWDLAKYGNKVSIDDKTSEADFTGHGYGYIFGENPEADGRWYSTLPPNTKTLKGRRLTTHYTVTITDAGASFDSVEIEE
ncbi:hypothetical protein AGMMS50267_13800 [Spirochaetia bacterium]|nr:hypothetical protein AGMMS50267_13800 [Spirochaetia bacterium]